MNEEEVLIRQPSKSADSVPWIISIDQNPTKDCTAYMNSPCKRKAIVHYQVGLGTQGTQHCLPCAIQYQARNVSREPGPYFSNVFEALKKYGSEHPDLLLEE